MKIKSLFFLIFFIVLYSIAGCREAKQVSLPEPGRDLLHPTSTSSARPGTDLLATPSPSKIQAGIFFDESPIDSAFKRAIGERHIEPEGNVVFAYLYAVQWYNEYHFLLGAAIDPYAQEAYRESLHSRYQTAGAANAYAKQWADSDNAVSMFNEIARFYKLQAYDCLARANERGENKDLQSNEEELYRYLAMVNAVEYIPDDPQSYTVAGIDDMYKPLPVLSALPEEGIYLSLAPPFGEVLWIKGEKYYFPWSGGKLTPRAILPKLSLDDYDGDGIEELAIIVYVSSGTGVAVEELHIVEFDGNVWETGITAESIESLLLHRLSANYGPDSQEVIIKLDDQMIRVDASQADKKNSEEFRGLDLSDIIYFNADDGGLTVHIAIGICGFDYATPFEYVDFFADVVYNGTPFISLSNCRIE